MSNNKAKIVTITLLMLLAACGSGGSGGGGDGTNQNPGTAPTSAPAAPGDLSISVSGDSVSLSWSEVSEASGYKVYRDGSLLQSVSTTSFSESGLTYGTYLYEVTSVNDSGESANKTSASVDVHEAAPVAPTDLSASVSADSVSLSWSEVSGADSYKVYRDSSLLQSVSTNSFSDTKLDDADYLYEVASVNNYGESKASVSATVNNDPPAAPTNLTAAVNADSVNLNWNTVADATSYNVYRDGSLIDSPTTNAFTDTALADGTYLYEVSAVDDAGESTSKASVSATVNNIPPAAPTNLTASANGSNVNLTWNTVDDATSYNVYRDSSLIASPTTTTFTDTALADGTYLYEVSAVDDAGESTSKASVSATVNNDPPAAPTNLTAAVNADSVNLNWNTVADATSYNVYRDGSLIDSPTTNAFTDTALADGTYLYEVSAVDDAGESTSKASVSATVNNIPPAAPTNLTASANGSNVNLTWNTVDDATSYNVYRDSSLIASPTTTTFTDTALADGTYLYEVSAVDDAGESTSKASVSATVNNDPPAAPTNLTASVNQDSVNLTWDTVDDATEGYKVYRDSALIASPSTNAFTDTNLDDGTYSYEVSSVDAAWESTSKASASASISVDPLYAYQWHLANTGQKAFATFSGSSGEDINHSGALALGITGAGVRVNVIDTGLELQHQDLQANIVAGGSYDYLDKDSDPTNNTDTDGDHGTSVAGLIAAVGNNGIGISGVAGNAQLQGYNVLSLSGSTYDDYIFAHGGDETKLSDTDIYNKSLGSAPNADSRINTALLDALSCFTTGGSTDMSSGSSCDSALRSNLGAVYVKSAGNNFNADGDQICDALRITCWNVNMESEETYPYQTIVGALAANGEKSSYSTAGSAIWVSAPGGEYGWDYEYWDSALALYGQSYSYDKDNISDPRPRPAMVTIDQVGCSRGYTTKRVDFAISGMSPIAYTSFHENDTLNYNCEYTSTFNGTSSAAPVVSGVVALMLEANPDLSWRDVKHILASSARQVDADIAAANVPAVVCINSDCSANNDGYTHTYDDVITFTARDAWVTNAAGYNYHNWYGFGAVNAGAAVAMAQTYSSPLGTWQKNSYQLSPSLAIPDSAGASATVDFSVADALTVEAVQLDLDITHACIFELAVVVYSPSGTRSVILTPYNQFNCDPNFSSTLLTNAFYGESAVGDWQVKIYDIWETNSGTLNSVSLNIYGH